MRLIVFALPLLAATATFAQSSAQPLAQSGAANPTVTKATPSILLPIGVSSCPVAMSAQQAALGQTIWTISREDAGQPRNEAVPRSSDSGVHVELDSLPGGGFQGNSSRGYASRGKAIRQVELAVYFVPPGGRVLLLQARAADAPELKKTFNLSADGGAALQLAGDLLVGPAASITRVRVLRIEYTDRTAWQPSGNVVCSVEPNRFLLVGAR
jgi:hypothetical protein